VLSLLLQDVNRCHSNENEAYSNCMSVAPAGYPSRYGLEFAVYDRWGTMLYSVAIDTQKVKDYKESVEPVG
jgi:hypothetical protein